MISLLHPSRGRFSKSRSTIQNWISKSTGPDIEVVVSVDNDDPDRDQYCNYYSDGCIVNKNRSAVDAINVAARAADGDIFIVVSDDTECPYGWDRLIINAIDGRKDWILKTMDGIQPWIITMPVLDRAYYNRFKYIYNPGYLHMFCDTEITCVADITGRKLTSSIVFPHQHYSVTKERPDEINRKADSTWSQGESLFLERYKRNFDLPPGLPIQDKGMIDYLKRKAR
jgi:glycosyltransferase involved in cell wall biosynthesis